MTYQILKPTACRVASHIWLWTGSSTQPSKEPHPLSRCDCGRWLWGEYKGKDEGGGMKDEGKNYSSFIYKKAVTHDTSI